MNVASLAVESIEKFGEFTATWFEDRQYTNLENYDRACRLASVLSSHGVGPDSRVVVMMLNSPDVLAAFLAIWKLGAVIIPVTPMWTAREVGYVLENSESGLVITSPELAPRVMDAALNVPSSPAIVTIGKSDVPGVTD
ncbi:MAG TPA: AMP-binding protein, partial [Marmoricola sp.]|nr:AMP-binding protein [Marmoricola sp.]